MKKYDAFKKCTITTATDEYTQTFTSDFKFSDIESWMLDTYCIDKESIITIEISNVTIYKIKNNEHSF